MKHSIKRLLGATKLSAIALALTLTASCSNEEDLETLESTTTPELSGLSLTGKEVPDNAPACSSSGINPTSKRRSKEREYLYSDINSNDPDVNRAGSESINNTIDDRTCAYNYSQIYSTPSGQSRRRYGRYRLRANSNNIDDLQPRIERASVSRSDVSAGSYIRFTGDVIIKSVGNFTRTSAALNVGDRAGTYIAQAKGQDSNAGIPNDPALALILVKPTDASQSRFNFYLEIITERKGGGSDGREIKNLNFSCGKNDLVRVKLENGLRTANNSAGKTHKIVVRLDNLSSSSDTPRDQTFDLPDPGSATSIKIRYGAYRCWNGEAQILWKNVKIAQGKK
jgi:hypothetical protein